MIDRLMMPLLALVAALLVASAGYQWLYSNEQQVAAVEPPPPPEPAFKKVLVAARDMETGSLLGASDLSWQEWPDVVLPPVYVTPETGKPEDFAGSVLRRPLATGQPVTSAQAVKPEQGGFLALVLEVGKRAVSLPIDESSGNAGLIFPGDRVDLILTHTVDLTQRGGDVHRVAETVIEDVRVIAVGQRLKSAAPEEAGAGNHRTVTLEVEPAQAESIAVVQQLGRLSLSLRPLETSPAPNDDAPSRALMTWDNDVSRATNAKGKGTSMKIYRGGNDG